MEAPSSTLWLGNLDVRVTRRHLYELGIQAGPVASVSLPQEEGANGPCNRGYGFIDYESPDSAAYAVRLFERNLRLFDRPVRVQFGGHSGGNRRDSGGSSLHGAPFASQQAPVAARLPG